MQIRLATKSDVPVICDLYPKLYALMSQMQPLFWKTASPDKQYLENFVENENSDIFVAQSDNQIIGFMLVRQQKTPPYSHLVPHNYAYLMDVFVLEEFQNRGLGTLFVDQLMKWAKERQLDFVELNVLSNNTSAIRLYERLGFTTDWQTMRYML